MFPIIGVKFSPLSHVALQSIWNSLTQLSLRLSAQF